MRFRPVPIVARQSVATALWLLCLSVLAAEQRVELRPAAASMGRFQVLEFQIVAPGDYTNPFDPDEVDLTVQITPPHGAAITLPAFWSQPYARQRLTRDGRVQDWMYPTGQPGWQARFAPMETGRYQAVAVLRDHTGTVSSSPVSFEATPSANHGFLRASRRDPRFLEFSTGEPFFALGQNLAFIGSGQYVTLSKAEAIFGRLAANGANYLRIWTGCDDWALGIETRQSVWGRSWDWHPPIVPMPDGGAAARRCLRLAAGASLDVNLPQPLALKPATRYVVTGLIRTETNTVARLEIASVGPAELKSAPLKWTEFRREFTTGADEHWLPAMRFRADGGTAWLADLSLKEAAGGPELLAEADVNRPERGSYNLLDGFMLDQLLDAAESRGLELQLCLLQRDLYMDALKDPASAEYDRAIADAKKFLRYAVARWGAYTSVAAWEYWNEMNPGLPTDRFYHELGDYLEHADPYHHLRTTSTWGPSAKDCHHPQLDLADAHFYLRPSDATRLRDEVDAVLERTRWLREQAPNKPAHLGEFGIADEKWQLRSAQQQSADLRDIHNALWASALSGASGTAQPWWWERLDEHNVYPLYRPLSAFVADVPWTSGDVQPAALETTGESLQAAGLRTRDRAWLWLFDHAAAWQHVVVEHRPPAEVRGAALRLKDWPPGTFHIQWCDTHTGNVVSEETGVATSGTLRLPAPAFTGDIACRVFAEPPK